MISRNEVKEICSLIKMSKSSISKRLGLSSKYVEAQLASERDFFKTPFLHRFYKAFPKETKKVVGKFRSETSSDRWFISHEEMMTLVDKNLKMGWKEFSVNLGRADSYFGVLKTHGQGLSLKLAADIYHKYPKKLEKSIGKRKINIIKWYLAEQKNY